MRASDSPRPALSALIIGFCLWHMLAVTLYNVPLQYLGPLKGLRNISDPYILSLSQWQYWDIFSPDPMRRVPVFIVERNAGDRWETAMVMTYADLPWWLKVKEMKVLDRIAGAWSGLTLPYLTSLCPEIPYSADKDIRLTIRWHILPSDLPSLTTMSSKRFFQTSQLLGSARCPPL